MKISLIFSCLLISLLSAWSQSGRTETVSVIFLNTDNLFDVTDDPGNYDNAYTPAGEHFWGPVRYDEKIKVISELIGSVTAKGLPDIIALAEVENRTVVEDLLSQKGLKRGKYNVLMEDNEGQSDVALLYKTGTLKVLEHKLLKPEPALEIADNASILYLKGELSDGRIYHLFINQWPCRDGSSVNSEQKRISCAVTVRKEVDRILNFEREARIIIMGSFNDEPTNRSLLGMLNATNKRKNLNQRDLYNLFYDIHNFDNRGSLVINGIWQMYDQIIVSPVLLKESECFHTSFQGGQIYNPDSKHPVSTFTGNDYTAGPGRNHPVYLLLSRDKPGK
ncbi:MAG: endonuclease/exonuclease/phosphatase family protein [Bacteroidales bacterium]|nr:endonuclease/exonuclease/phosphatase family protein [Bacteroidales bacterium]